MTGDRVRDEAERLVAAALTAISASLRAGQAVGPTLATGSAECCICPVCRAIAAVRDPSSDLADRLAAGVGDIATGVAGLLRVLSARGERVETTPTTDDDQLRERPGPAANTEWWEELRRKAADAAQAYARRSTRDAATSTVDDPWRVATREPAVAEASGAPHAGARKATTRTSVARKAAPRQNPPAHTATPEGTRATKKAAAAKAAGARAAGARAAGARAAGARAAAKNAVARKAAGQQAGAKPDTAKKAATPDGAA